MTFIGTILKRIKVNQKFRRRLMIKELSCMAESSAKIYGLVETFNG